MDDPTITLTGDIVASYLASHRLAAGEVVGLIAAVHGALSGLGQPKVEERPKLTATEIRRSITPDYLVSFLDGRSYKSLKRHIVGAGMTPETYRERYGLPHDYPMVSANYSAARSELARANGLGSQRRKRAARS